MNTSREYKLNTRIHFHFKNQFNWEPVVAIKNIFKHFYQMQRTVGIYYSLQVDYLNYIEHMSWIWFLKVYSSSNKQLNKLSCEPNTEWISTPWRFPKTGISYLKI